MDRYAQAAAAFAAMDKEERERPKRRRRLAAENEKLFKAKVMAAVERAMASPEDK